MRKGNQNGNKPDQVLEPKVQQLANRLDTKPGAAEEADQWTKAQGNEYNGGMFHGMSCGRDKTWDHVDKEGRKLYAVTF